ncbi:hypothetical protein U9M48_026593 [Paspalum notatum var. saurae]|uniref:Uncharacterized protein n=1 Tax=Paspalum notatum var. saurae TaxID=547442 RepID=A0AAQ3WZC4_PASNO
MRWWRWWWSGTSAACCALLAIYVRRRPFWTRSEGGRLAAGGAPGGAMQRARDPEVQIEMDVRGQSFQEGNARKILVTKRRHVEPHSLWAHRARTGWAGEADAKSALLATSSLPLITTRRPEETKRGEHARKQHAHPIAVDLKEAPERLFDATRHPPGRGATEREESERGTDDEQDEPQEDVLWIGRWVEHGAIDDHGGAQGQEERRGTEPTVPQLKQLLKEGKIKIVDASGAASSRYTSPVSGK